MMVYDDIKLKKILQSLKTIVMVGVSTNTLRASHFVGRYFTLRGIRIIPVNPAYKGQELWGEKVFEKISDIPKGCKVDMVDVFRSGKEVPLIIEDTIKYLIPEGCKTIWMQIGVKNEESAKIAKNHGLDVIMDRCPKIEYQRLFGELRAGGFNTGIISSRIN